MSEFKVCVITHETTNSKSLSMRTKSNPRVILHCITIINLSSIIFFPLSPKTPLGLLRVQSVSLASRLKSAQCGGTHQRTTAVLPSRTMWSRRGRHPGSPGLWSHLSVRLVLSMPPTLLRAMSTSSESLLSTSLELVNLWTLILSSHGCNTVSML